MAKKFTPGAGWASALRNLENEVKGWSLSRPGSSMGYNWATPGMILGEGGQLAGFAPDLGGQIYISGLAELEATFGLVDARVKAAALMVLKEEAAGIWAESQEEVPVDTEKLKRSGYIHEGMEIPAMLAPTSTISGGYASVDYGGSMGVGFRPQMGLAIPEVSIGYDVGPGGAFYGVYVHEIPPPPEGWQPTSSRRHDVYDKSKRKGKGRLYRGLDMQSISGGMRYARHKPPTKWKFLSDPFERSMRTFPLKMVAAVQAAIASVQPIVAAPVAPKRALGTISGPRLRKK